MARPNEQRFQLRAEVTASAPRKGEVRITSAITRYKWDEDDVTSNDFHRQMQALGDVDEITVRINSPGGAVAEAVAIRSELMRSKAAKVIEIEGMCASAATIIACMPGAHVRMAQGSEYMIHRCLYGAWGHADDLLAAYNSMLVTDGNLAEIYAERTGKSREDCLALMAAETWYTPEEAEKAGFVDEVVIPGEEALDMVACAVDPESLRLMKACYANVPALPEWTQEQEGTREDLIRHACGATPVQGPAGPSSLETSNRDVSRAFGPPTGEGLGARNDNGENGEEDVSNGSSAVAAEDFPSENTEEGVNGMDELRNATAEQLSAENPALVASIAQQAVAQERERMQKIDRLTPKGAKFQALAKKAKEDGTSVQDYLEQVIAAQEQEGQEYLEARAQETAPANNVGGGDSKDNDDDPEAKADKAAKEIAEIAQGMNPGVTDMA